MDYARALNNIGPAPDDSYSAGLRAFEPPAPGVPPPIRNVPSAQTSLVDMLMGALRQRGETLAAHPTPAADAMAGAAWNAVDFPAAAMRGEVDPLSDEGIARATDAAGMATTGGLMAPAVRGGVGMGIKAYHASPHDFDRFDMSKVGTGQGAQSYGHGMYAAESEKVSGRGGEYDQEFSKPGKPAKIYEVDIDASPDEFLDWDKPLSEQSPKVQKILADEWLAHPEAHAHQTGGQIYESSRIVPGDYRDSAGAAEALRAAGIKGIRYKDAGSRNVKPWRIEFPDGHVQYLDEATAKLAQGPGSEGVLAGGKLVKNEQTSNYVVFDDKTISILKKYGLAGLTGGGAAAGALQGEDEGAY